MKAFKQAFSAEALKTFRSKVPALTLLGLSLGPLVGGFFMVVLKDPEKARKMGMIGAKAHLVGNADWPSYFGFLAQIIAMGGMIVFAFAASWVFGREFADRTVRGLLATPTPRSSIVAAKFSVIALWSALLSAWVFALGFLIGKIVVLPGLTRQLALSATFDFFFCAFLTILLLPAVALVACLGRGYLAALGFTFLTLFIGQIAAATGWGAWCPWSIPAIFSGAAGPRGPMLFYFSYWIVAITSLAGAFFTFAWWNRADHTT
ncbi:MAG TPA: bacitracin ABC transporter permease [Cyanobacteria bacterium UBA8530]|nr:bacitracin ABC transporter permease [Cyanobacteria bacterium UBA8530]